jgi:hypothetical protein
VVGLGEHASLISRSRRGPVRWLRMDGVQCTSVSSGEQLPQTGGYALGGWLGRGMMGCGRVSGRHQWAAGAWGLRGVGKWATWLGAGAGENGERFRRSPTGGSCLSVEKNRGEREGVRVGWLCWVGRANPLNCQSSFLKRITSFYFLFQT